MRLFTPMRVRIRGPTGSSLITLTDADTVNDLLRLIEEKTSLRHYEVRHGYPPKLLDLHAQESSRRVSELDVKLDGEQLIVAAKDDERSHGVGGADGRTTAPDDSVDANEKAGKPSEGDASVSQASKRASKQAPLSLTRAPNKALESDPPEIPLPDHGSTLVLRIMPDDNSCLFRAVGTALMNSLDSMTELRALVAQSIQAQPDTYSAAVLDQLPDEYCRWIQTEYSWGGFIELNILSTHFGVEICSIDVQTLRIDRFNEGKPTRCILVYSGIHYDTVALSPSEPPYRHTFAPPEFDTTVFDSEDQVVLDKAVELCKILQSKHYFTDTAGFAIRCNVCGGQFVGEKGATQHAKETGHLDFGEAD